MADIRIVEPQSEPTEISTPDNGMVRDGVLLNERVGQMFDLRPSELSQYKGKLDVLIEYAKLKSDDHSPESLKWVLRTLGMKLGTPPLGEKLINYLHNYAKIYMQGRRIEEQKAKYLRGERDDD